MPNGSLNDKAENYFGLFIKGHHEIFNVLRWQSYMKHIEMQADYDLTVESVGNCMGGNRK